MNVGKSLCNTLPCLFGEDGIMWLSAIVPPLLITDTEDDEMHVLPCPPIETGEEGSSLTLTTSICSTEARSLDSDDCLL